MIASYFGHTDIVHHLLPFCKTSVNARDNVSVHYLDYGSIIYCDCLCSSFWSHLSLIVCCMIQHGVTILHYAAYDGDMTLVKYLIR